MKKKYLGLILGLLFGILDVIPMLLQKLPWDANFSALSLWIVSGFLISVSEIKVKSFLKGIIVVFLVLIPTAIIIANKEPFSLIPICIISLILSSLLGYFIEKYGK